MDECDDLEIGIGLCLDHTLELDVTVRRLEVIKGMGRRRRFSDDDKARIVEETLLPRRWFPRLLGATG